MKSLLGIGFHNPLHTEVLLESFCENNGVTSMFLNFGDDPKPIKTKGAVVYLVPSVAKALRHQEFFEREDCHVIVYDDPTKLEHLGCDILDVNGKPHSYEYIKAPLTRSLLETKLTEYLKGRKTSNTVFNKETLALLPTLLDEVEGSLTQHLLGIFYNINVPDQRYTITKYILEWVLSSKQDFKAFEKKMKEMKVSGNGLTAFVDFLKSEEGGRAMAALKYIAEQKSKGKTVNFKKVEKDFSVAAFDLKYFLKQARYQDAVRFPELTTNEIHASRKKGDEILVVAEDDDSPSNDNGRLSVVDTSGD